MKGAKPNKPLEGFQSEDNNNSESEFELKTRSDFATNPKNKKKREKTEKRPIASISQPAKRSAKTRSIDGKHIT
jgi:hypothetical protein